MCSRKSEGVSLEGAEWWLVERGGSPLGYSNFRTAGCSSRPHALPSLHASTFSLLPQTFHLTPRIKIYSPLQASKVIFLDSSNALVLRPLKRHSCLLLFTSGSVYSQGTHRHTHRRNNTLTPTLEWVKSTVRRVLQQSDNILHPTYPAQTHHTPKIHEHNTLHTHTKHTQHKHTTPTQNITLTE